MITNNGLKQKTALVLGGTAPHKYLIENLKGRGYYTILIDYYDNPPAAKLADKHLKESTLDKDKVLEIARSQSADLVISGCVDQANLTACYVAEKLGLPAPFSYETAVRVTSKELMKAGMIKAGIPTSAYNVISNTRLDSFEASNYPLVVKPCDCNGSKGVQKVLSFTELKQALKEASNLSRTGKAIVEEFNNGKELSLYYIIAGATAVPLYIKGKRLFDLNGKANLASFMTIGPEPISPLILNKLTNSVRAISSEFSLDNTLLLVQANYTDTDVSIIEFAPRVGGGLSSREMVHLLGIDVIDLVVSSYLQHKLRIPQLKKATFRSCVVHLYGKYGTYHSCEGLNSLIHKGVIQECHFHKMQGMTMRSDDLASRNRVLGVIIRGKDDAEIYSKIKIMVSAIKIINTDGHDVLDRNLFSFLGF